MNGKAAGVGVAGLTLVLAAVVLSPVPQTPITNPVTTTPVVTAPLSPVEIELQQYYTHVHDVPKRWTQSIHSLRSADQSVRKESAAYLTELLSQILADERSGAAPWRATPFWGSSGENPARELRSFFLSRIAISPAKNAETVAVLDWFVENEILPDSQVEAAEGLCNISNPQSDEILRKHIQQPHSNLVVLRKLIDSAADRNLAIEPEWLAPLCLNRRKSIRTAARKLNSQLGYPDPAPFDPVAAIQRKEFRALMRRMSEYILEPAPPNARLVKATETIYYPYFDEPSDDVHTGWVTAEIKAPPLLVIQTPYGWRETYPSDGKPWLDYEKTKHEITVRDYSVEDEVTRLEELRRTGDPKYALSEGGTFTGQFEGHGAGLYETLFGEWLYRSRRYESAARILLPALETLYRDDDLVELVKHSLGQNYGYRMLAAFAGDRDYDETLRWAKAISKRFPETLFHDYATRLVRQIPQRRDDFKTLTLPTPEQWAEIRKKMSRRKQIDYLCKRVRLLNCFQGGQPSRIYLNRRQYAEPSGMRRDASIGHYLGKTLVINPFSELTGHDVWGLDDDLQPQGLHLTVADIPQLAAYLRDDWFILAVGFWRDFFPSRTLTSTREIFGNVINEIARQQLCNAGKLERMNSAKILQEIARIADWSRQNASLTETELLLQALEVTLAKEGGRWHDIEEQANRLSELRAKEAIPLLRRFLELDEADRYTIPDILRCCRLIDAKSVQDLGQRYLNRQELSIRIQAALIALKGTDPQAARQVLGPAFLEANAGEYLSEHVYDAVAGLLEEGSAASRELALKVFDGLGLARDEDFGKSRVAIVHKFASLGEPVGYEFYLKLLDPQVHRLLDPNYRVPDTHDFADEVIYKLAPDDPEIIKIRDTTFDAPDKRVSAVQAWLQRRVRKMRAAQKTTSNVSPKKPE